MGALDGKVILVTGAGNGIGKACALAAAAEGAKVVVNDLGSGLAGAEPGSAQPAEQVVAAIKAAGGAAVANADSVTDRAGVRQMIVQALDEFGGLHAVINPAGILRDKMFHKMDDADWDAVVDVHLNGAYNVARAAVNHFRDQEDGCFVLFSSTSGLIGNLGQSNYGAAKMGVAGLSHILAMEGARKGIRSNAIAPFAFTRMIESIPVTDEQSAQRVERMRQRMRADQVAQFCVALCADGARDISGQIFAVRGNEIMLMSQPRPVRSVGMADGWTVDGILQNCLPTMKPDFTDLKSTAEVFNWPVV